MDKIDQLIDDAFAKDKARLPEQPNMPSASLLDKVHATKPAAIISADNTSFFTSMTMKVVGTMALMAVIATIVYLLTRPQTVSETPGAQNISAPPADTIRSVTERTAPMSINDSLKIAPKSKTKRAAGKDSVSTDRANSESDLIMPTTPPPLYKKDTAIVKFKKK
jgi:hypothetical protein